MNKIFLTGRLTKDADLTYTQSGKAIYKNSIAVNDGYGDNKKTYFFDIVSFDKSAELFAESTFKGQSVSLIGKLTKRDYENKSGQKVNVFEIIIESLEWHEYKDKPKMKSVNPFENAQPIELADGELPF